MTLYYACLRAAFSLLATSLALAQESGQAAAGQRSLGRWNGLRVSGLVDVYASLNFNHPRSDRNPLRNFDGHARQFRLNLARLGWERPAEPWGFRLEAGVGEAPQTIHAAADEPEVCRYFQQAYFRYALGGSKEVRLDFGKFVTSAGGEVIETHRNWNYSRSLLFAYAVPYFHFGMRATADLGAGWEAGAQLVNGWNNLRDRNGAKTIGLTAGLRRGRLSFSQAFYAGPEKTTSARGWRSLYDVVLSVEPAPRVALSWNADYGWEGAAPHESGGRWGGVAGTARFVIGRRLALAPRLEWFNDPDGLATGGRQRLCEGTLTVEWKLQPGVLTRLEYRRDWSNRSFFPRGSEAQATRNQQTLLLGLIWCFGCEP